MEEIQFTQLNMHRANVAVVELNKLIGQVPSVCLLTEPYTAYNKVAQVPANHTVLPGTPLASRPRAAIFLPKHMPHVFLEQLSSEDIVVALIHTKRGKILVASGYLDSNKPVVQPWLKKLMSYIEEKNYPAILGFDSNAHSQLFGPTTNERGKHFEEFILQYNLKVENRGEAPTYHQFRTNGSVDTCIDITLSRNLVPLHDWRVHSEAFNGSDHKTITWSLPLDMGPKQLIRPWKRADWKVFTNKIAEHDFSEIPQNFTARKADKFLDRIYRVINGALDEACPKREARPSPLETKWYGNDQRYLFNRTKRRFKAYIRDKSARRRKSYISAKRIYSKSCRKAKRASWRKFVEGTPDEFNMAILARIAQRKEKREINTLLKDDNTLTEPGADTIKRLMEAHFPAAVDGVAPSTYSNTKINTTDIQQKYSKWINPELVSKALRRFKPNKAPGPDGLKPIVFRHFPPNIIEALTLLFQVCIALGHTPSKWRDTRVIFLPKPGKKSYDIPKAYRPISLSNFLLKTLERLVVWKMDADLEKKPLHTNQHGFTKGKCTESAISSTADYIEQFLFERQHCLGVFLDISSAFDSISIEHIRDSLLEHNGDPELVQWYYSYLGKRHLEISLHGDTVHLTTGRGFPQGGVCSARFWLIAFNNAIKIINSAGIYGTGYADDCSALIGGDHPSNMIEQMQAMLDRLVRWGESCGLVFNAQKTVVVMFTRATREFHHQVRMNGALIPYSKTVVYLGVTMDAELYWTQHVKNKIKKTKSLLMKLASITSSYWGPQAKLMRWAWTGIVRPVMSYAAMTWGHVLDENDSLVTALRRLNRLAMNTIVRVPRSTPTQTMEIVLGITPLHLHIKQLAMASHQRLQLPILWDGIFTNLEHAVAHRRFWEYTLEDMGDTGRELSTDECWEDRPPCKFKVETDSYKNSEKYQQYVSCNVYTDGSKKQDKVGAGIYIIRDAARAAEEKFRLPDTATVFQAEVMAIREAAAILKVMPALTTVKFFVDSQAALKALDCDTITSKLVLQTITTLNEVSAQSITFIWTKAHVGTRGNEIADRLAKEGTELDDIMEVPIPAITRKQQIKQAINKEWNREWLQYNDGRQSKIFVPNVTTKIANEVINWPRLKLGRYIRAISGHNNLLYHLHNIKKHIPPGCRFCGEENEEFVHLAYNCTALYWQQHDIEAMIPETERNWTPQQIVDFTFIPKIDDAFTKPLYDIDEDKNHIEAATQLTDEPDQDAHMDEPNDQLSEDSLMEIESMPSSSEEYDTEYEQYEDENDMSF